MTLCTGKYVEIVYQYGFCFQMKSRGTSRFGNFSIDLFLVMAHTLFFDIV
jgi:hypothetical protein